MLIRLTNPCVWKCRQSYCEQIRITPESTGSPQARPKAVISVYARLVTPKDTWWHAQGAIALATATDATDSAWQTVIGEGHSLNTADTLTTSESRTDTNEVNRSPYIALYQVKSIKVDSPIPVKTFLKIIHFWYMNNIG